MTPAFLSHWRGIAEAVFPWIARFTIAPEPKAPLHVRSANGLLYFEGGGRAASGKGHRCGRLAVDSTGALCYHDGGSAATYTAIPTYGLPGPIPAAFAGTDVVIQEGSARVEIDNG